MTYRHRPTAEEKRIIRDCAARGAGFRSVEVNPSTRVNLTDPDRGAAMNVLLVADHIDQTDLFDNAYAWSDFTRGFDMTDDGRAIIDFYVYNRGQYPELQTNITAYWEKGRLVRVDDTSKPEMWRMS